MYLCLTRLKLFRGTDHISQNLACLIKRTVHWLVLGGIMWYYYSALRLSAIILSFGLPLTTLLFQEHFTVFRSLLRSNSVCG